MYYDLDLEGGFACDPAAGCARILCSGLADTQQGHGLGGRNNRPALTARRPPLSHRHNHAANIAANGVTHNISARNVPVKPNGSGTGKAAPGPRPDPER